MSPVEYDLSVLDAAGTHGLIGVDEVGRGALAGPVVAAAAYVPKRFLTDNATHPDVCKVHDSKRLSPEGRECIADRLEHAWSADGVVFRIGLATVREIDDLNILGATRLAMNRALEALLLAVENSNSWPSRALLVDGKPMRGLCREHSALVRGDMTSFSIGLASIVAKVSRDRMMIDLDRDFPVYGFARHKGYGVESHRQAITRQGPCEHHRALFLRKITYQQRQEELQLDS